MKGSEICGPYVDGAAYNRPSETVFLCVKCCKQEYADTEIMPLMYDDMADRDTIPCDECNRHVRQYDGT